MAKIKLSAELRGKFKELVDACLPEKSAAIRKKAVKRIEQVTIEYLESLPKVKNA